MSNFIDPACGVTWARPSPDTPSRTSPSPGLAKYQIHVYNMYKFGLYVCINIHTIPWFSKISNKCTYKYTHPTAGLAKYQNIYVQIYISSFPGWAKYQIYCGWWSTTHWVTQVCKECFGHLVLKANYTEQKVCPPEHWTVHELSICSTHMEVRYNTGKLCCPRHML